MTFGDALEKAKAGRVIARESWVFQEEVFTRYSRNMTPYLVIQSRNGDAVPYTVTDTDLFANDWGCCP